MPTIAVRKTTYDGLNAVQKAIVGAVAARLQLGQPAVYLNGATPWLCFDDDRISLDDLALLGAVAANLAALANFVIQQGTPTRTQLLAWAAGKVVWPSSIDYTNQANPWQYTLTQQGAPVSVQAASAVPAAWAPSP